MRPYRPVSRYLFCASLTVLLPACENNDNADALTQENNPSLATTDEPLASKRNPDVPETPQTRFNIGNKSYLFDVSEHTIEEMESLLVRANDISELEMHDYPDLEIVMIIHGPDIDWFTPKNHERNRKLVNLAEKLDALDIIDMKVCEKTMQSRSIKPEDIPAFIEPVPYAPDEIKRLNNKGFINL